MRLKYRFLTIKHLCLFYLSSQSLLGNAQNIYAGGNGAGHSEGCYTQQYTVPNIYTGGAGQGTGIDCFKGLLSEFPLASNPILLNANQQQREILITWEKKAKDGNVTEYQVQKSVGLNHWETIGIVKNEANMLSFTFLDISPVPGLQYYRVKEVLGNRRFLLSNLATLFYNLNGARPVVYPNPCSTVICIDNPSSTSYDLEIFNAKGISILHEKNVKGIKHRIDIATFPAGIYLIWIWEAERSTGIKVLKK